MPTQDRPPLDVEIRNARPGDGSAIFALIRELADFERLSHQVSGTPELLEEHLFGEPVRVHALLAELDGQPVGYAIFFFNYSTFLTKPGLYLEDIYVTPALRGAGLGKRLLAAVAERAVDAGCGRFEWAVLDWNEGAIDFYQRLGATVMPDWRICRLEGEELAAVAGVHNRRT